MQKKSVSLANIDEVAKDISTNKQKARKILTQSSNLSTLLLDLKELHTLNGW